MKSIAALLLTSAILHAQPVYLGTGADGIYLADFDAEKGTLTQPELAAEFKQPGFLALHPEIPVLYSIGGNNKVAAFTIAEDKSLTMLGEASCGGNGPATLPSMPPGAPSLSPTTAVARSPPSGSAPMASRAKWYRI